MKTRSRTATTLVLTGILVLAPLTSASAAFSPREELPTSGTVRLSGESRIATAIETSGSVFSTGTGVVVLASANNYADSISGGVLAASLGAPLLLTEGRDGLEARVDDEVSRLLPDGGRIIFLGGPAAVPQAVLDELGSFDGYEIERVSGPDRYATSAAVARVIAPSSASPIYLASGTDYPDGLAVSPLAAAQGGVVLLTEGSVLPAATSAYLAREDPVRARTVAVGGDASRAYRGPSDVVGADRYETSARIAARFGGDVNAVGFSTGSNWPDALVGAAAMGSMGGPLLLMDGPDLGAARDVADKIRATHPEADLALVFGGDMAVSSSLLGQVAALF